MRFSKFRNLAVGLGLIVTGFGAPLYAQDTLPPVKTWDVVKEEVTKQLGGRTLVPPGETAKEWTVQAREERFKGMGLLLSGADVSETLVKRLGQACHDPASTEPATHPVGDYEATFVRVDCPKLRVGGEMLTIMSMAWVEVTDLQTKQLVFKHTPSDAEVALAMEFLKIPAEKVDWIPDS